MFLFVSKIDDESLLLRTAAASVLGAIYSYPAISVHDPVVEKVENYVDRLLKAALPGQSFLIVLNDLPNKIK